MKVSKHDEHLNNQQHKRANIVNVGFLIGLPVLAAISTPVYFSLYGWHWGDLILFFVLGAVTCMSITAGYHRLLAHRSYETPNWVKAAYLIFGAMAFQGPALVWGADHRRHHRFVDSKMDPHNIREGFFHAHMGWMLFHDGECDAETYAPDLLKNKWVQWQNRNYVWLAIVMSFYFPMALGALYGNPMGGLIIGGLLRLVFTQHCTFFINSLAHTVGSKTYNDDLTARDSVLMAVLAYGEGYHNFHHQFQVDYRNGIRWYHWDPTKWVIQLLALMGCAYKLRQASPSEILGARLKAEQLRLLSRGVPEEKVSALKCKVEEAQTKFRLLREEYKRLKRNMQQQSREYLLHLKAEVKIARLEFKMAFAQWVAYRRTLGALPIRA
jgi:stearoyl-CoA desaturase (Delta-9 desaturase)